ncbi:hypothetical protein EDB86DRAFT_2824755 [Lactarius hatsudake]|nr:hypothetical protein EDB86DRAFT_2824755 [Lactarius hatsudake]
MVPVRADSRVTKSGCGGHGFVYGEGEVEECARGALLASAGETARQSPLVGFSRRLNPTWRPPNPDLVPDWHNTDLVSDDVVWCYEDGKLGSASRQRGQASATGPGRKLGRKRLDLPHGGERWEGVERAVGGAHLRWQEGSASRDGARRRGGEPCLLGGGGRGTYGAETVGRNRRGLEGKGRVRARAIAPDATARRREGVEKSPRNLALAKVALNLVGALLIGFTFFQAKDSIQGTQNKIFPTPAIAVLAKHVTGGAALHGIGQGGVARATGPGWSEEVAAHTIE